MRFLIKAVLKYYMNVVIASFRDVNDIINMLLDVLVAGYLYSEHQKESASHHVCLFTPFQQLSMYSSVLLFIY